MERENKIANREYLPTMLSDMLDAVMESCLRGDIKDIEINVKFNGTRISVSNGNYNNSVAPDVRTSPNIIDFSEDM